MPNIRPRRSAVGALRGPTEPDVAALLKRLQSMGSAANLAGMARFGINTRNAFGVSVTALRELARELPRSHELAAQLWKTGNREARILAAHVGEPAVIRFTEMDRWARSFDSWDICDNCCIHFFRKSPLAWDAARRWSLSQSEFVRRAGFALTAALAVHDKHASDESFLAMLPTIEQAASDDRNFVKKAVNWALRQIGKRNLALHCAAMKTARCLMLSSHSGARWVGRDALRELQSAAVRMRLQVRKNNGSAVHARRSRSEVSPPEM